MTTSAAATTNKCRLLASHAQFNMDKAFFHATPPLPSVLAEYSLSTLTAWKQPKIPFWLGILWTGPILIWYQSSI